MIIDWKCLVLLIIAEDFEFSLSMILVRDTVVVICVICKTRIKEQVAMYCYIPYMINCSNVVILDGTVLFGGLKGAS